MEGPPWALGLCGPSSGPCGPPWALEGPPRALVGLPGALVGSLWALLGPLGSLWAPLGPLGASHPWALVGTQGRFIYKTNAKIKMEGGGRPMGEGVCG